MPSEFYRITTTSTPIPVDLAGAKQVLMQSLGAATYISNDESFDNYFTIQKGDPDTALFPIYQSLSNDARLWVKSDSYSIIEIWVTK